MAFRATIQQGIILSSQSTPSSCKGWQQVLMTCKVHRPHAMLHALHCIPAGLQHCDAAAGHVHGERPVGEPETASEPYQTTLATSLATLQQALRGAGPPTHTTACRRTAWSLRTGAGSRWAAQSGGHHHSGTASPPCHRGSCAVTVAAQPPLTYQQSSTHALLLCARHATYQPQLF